LSNWVLGSLATDLKGAGDGGEEEEEEDGLCKGGAAASSPALED
jgi:hypothetical protein